MSASSNIAKAPNQPPAPDWYTNMFRTNPQQDHPSISPLKTIPYTSYSDIRVLDVEADMTQSLIELDPNARPKHFRNAYEECIFIFMVMMSTAATTFLQGVIIINTATIGKDLKMNSAEVTWISAAIGLASGSFMLFFGKTADLFGRKIQLLCGMAYLAIFSLLTAFAPTPVAMNVLCGFLGLGTAIISPPAIGTLFATYPEGIRRNKAAGALGAGNPVGFILGSISSGIATKYWSWRASFFVISIFFLVMTIMAFWVMPSIPRSGNTRMQVRQFDYLGTMLTITGMALFSTGLTQGPEMGWTSPSVIVILILGVFCLFGFAFWEHIFTHPLLNPVVWKNRTFTLCVLCTMLGYMSFITNQFWISLYMQEVQKLAPLHIAARLLPQAIAGIIWSYIGQALADKVNGTILMGIGGIAYLVGATLLIFVRKDTSYWRFLFPALMITVLGADFQFIISNLYITKQMPRQASLAAGVLQTAMRLSISIGLGITGAIYGSAHKSPQGRKDVNFPYCRAYLCGILFAALGLLFIPFMNIDTQGGKTPPRNPRSMRSSVEARPRRGGEFSDDPSTREELEADGQISLGSKASKSTLWSGATAGSEESYFPRWSWEDERWIGSRGERYKGAEVVYEVCVKCLEERRVVLVGSTETLVSNGHPNDGIHGVWNSARTGDHVSHYQIEHANRDQKWNGSQWNNGWNHHWYAQQGVREGGDGWL